MVTYIDTLKHRGMEYQGRKVRSCHMMANNISELHDMAEQLGVRKWFQEHPRHPHYDLMVGKRTLAKKFGAIETNTAYMLRKCINGTNKTTGKGSYSI